MDIYLSTNMALDDVEGGGGRAAGGKKNRWSPGEEKGESWFGRAGVRVFPFFFPGSGGVEERREQKGEERDGVARRETEAAENLRKTIQALLFLVLPKVLQPVPRAFPCSDPPFAFKLN